MGARCETLATTLRDGGQQYRMVVTAPEGPQTVDTALDAAQSIVVIENGLLCGTGPYQRLSHELARHGFTVVTHDDPTDCYSLDAKADRSAAVVKRVAQNRPVTRLAFSQGALVTAATSDGLADCIDGHLWVAPAGVVVPAGVPAAFEEVDARVQTDMTQRMLGELGSIPRHAWRTAAGRQALRQFVQRGLSHGIRWNSLVREVHATLTADRRADIVALGGVVMGGLKDSYFAPTALAEGLQAVGFRGEVESYDGNHVAPLFRGPVMAQVSERLKELSGSAAGNTH